MYVLRKRRHNIKTLIFVYSLSPLGFIRIYLSSKCELCSNKRTSYIINSIFLWFLNYFRGTFIMFVQIHFAFFFLNSFKRTKHVHLKIFASRCCMILMFTWWGSSNFYTTIFSVYHILTIHSYTKRLKYMVCCS